MPELRFVLPGTATKKNSNQLGHRPSAAFEKWETEAIRVLRLIRTAHDPQRSQRLGGTALQLPISTPAILDITVYVKGNEGDGAGYVQAVGDVLDGTAAKVAHRKKERKLQLGGPLCCDWQIITDDRLFNKGLSARVIRVKDDPRVEVRITW